MPTPRQKASQAAAEAERGKEGQAAIAYAIIYLADELSIMRDIYDRTH